MSKQEWNGKPLDFLESALPEGYNTALFLNDDDLVVPEKILANVQSVVRLFEKRLNCWTEIAEPTVDHIADIFSNGFSHLFAFTVEKDVLVFIDVAEGLIFVTYKASYRETIFLGFEDEVSYDMQRKTLDGIIARTTGALQGRAETIRELLAH